MDTTCKDLFKTGIPFCVPPYCFGKENRWLGTLFGSSKLFCDLSYENSISQQTCHTLVGLLVKKHKLEHVFDSYYEDSIHLFLEECVIAL